MMAARIKGTLAVMGGLLSVVGIGVGAAVVHRRAPATRTVAVADAPQLAMLTRGLALNGCSNSGLPPAILAAHALTSDSLTNVAAVHDALCNVDSQAVLKYIIECALPAGVTIGTTADDGTDLMFSGGLGLTPEWGKGPCNTECQEWVTACLASRINIRGVKVQIFLTGPGRGLEGMITDQQRAMYPVEEGAFYGNIFAPGPVVMYACRGRGRDAFYRTVRVCTGDGSPCGNLKSIGTCDFFDGGSNLATQTRACESIDPNGYYLNCHNAVGDQNNIPGKVYKHVITIFTKGSDFTPDGGC